MANDIGSIGILVETLSWPNPELRDVAIKALVNLLPRLRASDTNRLSTSQRQALYGYLNMRDGDENVPFTIALLKALEQVGDKAAISYVNKLAEHICGTHPELQVREAAIECLPYLRVCAENAHNIQTLLRASSGENTSPELLLRPASNSPAAQPEQLLRPVDCRGGRPD